jgi:DNA polymerase V
MDRVYMCIDLKSFYASVECVERGLNALTTNLVVADLSRTEKTICLAVSPSLKSFGIRGRARLYEVVSKVRELNRNRKSKNKSYNIDEINHNKDIKIDYIIAKPRMKLYMDYSNKIYNIYLKYISKEDILVYSVDEVFCDITDYLKYYNKTKEELVMMIIKDVYESTGITATAGIGTNMYLAKIAMDIVAKHMDPNEYGVRMAYLDEYKYRELLWDHRPLTDFWRIGRGYATRLEKHGMYTIGDVARKSIDCEGELFKIFGVNAEILIDHAWGYEPCTIKIAKSYKPLSNSISVGQVLTRPYSYEESVIIVTEMVDSLVLQLVKKHLVTKEIIISVGYDIDNPLYDGEMMLDYYGRSVPKSAHGSINIDHNTSSTDIILKNALKLYKKIVNDKLYIRRITVAFNNVHNEEEKEIKQLDLFSSSDTKKEKEERKVQRAILDIQKKYGKNAILKGVNLEKEATGRERNKQVGGHNG